jgi:hypothetical protein
VTETDERPWKDCLWASGAMLLDKWTNGQTTRTHQQLRRLSGDLRGGSDLSDLRRAYARLGIDLTFSPDGGERIGWNTLLKRLANGAGAVLLGDYADLPRWYGRWDYSFWKLTKKEKASKDNHAVYIERYDRKRHRVWLMDPLGRGDWRGEWVSVSILRRYAWSSRGALDVAITPTARAAPFAGVTTSGPKVSMTATKLEAKWALRAPRRWSFPGADTRVAFVPASDPLRLAAASKAVTVAAKADRLPPRRLLAPPPRSPEDRCASRPPCSARPALTPPRSGSRPAPGRVAVAARRRVFIPGPRRACSAACAAPPSSPPLTVEISIGNTGTESWRAYDEPAVPRAAAPSATRASSPLDPVDLGDGADDPSATTPPTELGAVLAPGKLATIARP